VEEAPEENSSRYQQQAEYLIASVNPSLASAPRFFGCFLVIGLDAGFNHGDLPPRWKRTRNFIEPTR
jgi:hypothetical protein